MVSITVHILKAVHNVKNVVHHDIKPENILIDSNDDAKLSDFGISVKIEPGETDQIMNTEWGTKLYLPPESWNSTLQSYSDSPVFGKPKDVWALGCTFYQMIYGVTPFGNEMKPAEITKSVMHDQYSTVETLGSNFRK